MDMTLPTVLIILVASLSAHSAPLIKSKWGDILGVDRVSRGGVQYHAYLGIPYAKPPVGSLRFAKPEPSPGPEGVYNATEVGHICFSYFPFGLAEQFGQTQYMSEDCLVLNVYIPAAKRSGNHVVIMIHGGGFVTGSAYLSSEELVTRHDVIFVSIQYRLGVFGFMSTGSSLLPGNNGLWDQLLAIKWVKENIDAFGGNADDVSLMGVSAGAASVAFQTLHPGSKGLFQKAFLQSGAATSIWAIERNPRVHAATLGRKLGCLEGDMDSTLKEAAMIDCIKQVNASDILGQSVYREPLGAAVTHFFWVPVADGDFVADDPEVMMRDQMFLANTSLYDIDILVGCNNNEGGFLAFNTQVYDLAFNASSSTDVYKQDVYDNEIVPMVTEIAPDRYASRIKDFVRVTYSYPRPSPGEPLPAQQVWDTYADPSFVMPGLLFANSHVRRSKQNCFVYLFNHFPSFTGTSPVKGMTHGQDGVYLNGLLISEGLGFNTSYITREERTLSRTYVDFVASFLKTGNPNPGIDDVLGQNWPRYDLETRKYLSFGANMSIESDLFKERAALWLDFIPRLIWNIPDAPSPVTTSPPPIKCPPSSGSWAISAKYLIIVTSLVVISTLY